MLILEALRRHKRILPDDDLIQDLCGDITPEKLNLVLVRCTGNTFEGVEFYKCQKDPISDADSIGLVNSTIDLLTLNVPAHVRVEDLFDRAAIFGAVRLENKVFNSEREMSAIVHMLFKTIAAVGQGKPYNFCVIYLDNVDHTWYIKWDGFCVDEKMNVTEAPFSRH